MFIVSNEVTVGTSCAPSWTMLIASKGHEFLRQIVDIAPYFIDPRERDLQGGSAFLHACMPIDGFNPNCFCTFESEFNIQRLAILLDHAGSVHDRDEDGLTCLHRFFSGPTQPPAKQDWQASLIYLVRQGADVYAKDNWGMSVSHVAYSPSCQDFEFETHSYRGDLWDSVLDACGYDLREFRKGYPRTAEYTSSYSYSDFQALWKGREERCPYFYDKHWSSPYDPTSGQADDNERLETLCHCLSCDGHCNVLGGWSEESELGSSSLLDGDHDEDPANSGEPTTSRMWTLEQVSARMPSQDSEFGQSNTRSTAATAGEFYFFAFDEAAHSDFRGTTSNYGDIFNNPWLDSDTRRVIEVEEGEGNYGQAMAFSPWTD